MRHRTRKPSHPGRILKELYMDPLGLSVTRLAVGLKVSRKHLSRILNGHAAITPDMALRLSKAFRSTPEVWLNAQKTYDLWVAENESADWKDTAVFVPAEAG